MPRTPSIYQTCHSLQQRYLAVRSGKESLLELIDEAEVAEHVYNSNAIENSTLTLEETDKILQQIDLDRFISERELFEAKNLSRVVHYVRNTASEKQLNQEMILLLHKMLLSNIRGDIAGRFREQNEWVRVGAHIAADPLLITDLMRDMFNHYNLSATDHIIARVARFHLTFEHIHPFVDGNGRIGRVLNNYLLIQNQHVPINIKFLDRSLYYDAFTEFDKHGRAAIMEQIVGRALTASYHKRLAYLEGKTITTLADYAKQQKTSHSNLLNKAKRQTIPAFQERGIWKIGVPISSDS